MSAIIGVKWAVTTLESVPLGSESLAVTGSPLRPSDGDKCVCLSAYGHLRHHRHQRRRRQ